MIFVFGSNTAGRHGKGAAKYAKDFLGAEYGVGEGITGRCYAIPTKDNNLKIIGLDGIEKSVSKFLSFAANNCEETFLVTPIGCGLAGYSKKQIRGLFPQNEISDNVVFSKHWFEN